MAAAAGANDRRVVDRELLMECVHCGFCLEACPTYALTRTEMDSPRGRIYAIKSLSEGKLELTPEVAGHLDFCLGCRGCETACPAGVHYGRLIEQARSFVEDNYRRPLGDRLRRYAVGALFPYPRRLNLLLAPLRMLERMGLRPALTRMLPGAMREWLELLPPLAERGGSFPQPAEGSTAGSGAAVAIHPGCVTQVLAASASRSSAQLLARAGYRVVSPAAVCCGALDLHSGNIRRALQFARANVRSFMQSGAGFVISTASGCTTAMAEYGELLKDDPELAEPARELSRKVTELSALLGHPPRKPASGALECTVTYHDACHLAHGLGVRQGPRDLLRAIPGVKLVEMEQSDTCCGSAGSYNLTQPDAARELGKRKADAVEATGADYLVLANPGCQFQIAAELARRGSRIKVIHLADFLTMAARG